MLTIEKCLFNLLSAVTVINYSDMCSNFTYLQKEIKAAMVT